MNLVALPAFADNYIWMLHDGREALVVDPGDARPVEDALDAHGLALTGILLTHHHADHVGGVQRLMPRLHGKVHGPAHEAMPVTVSPHVEGDRLQWNGVEFHVLDVPGHTRGHVAYDAPAAPQGPLLFCGDTLFSAGCGRLFEGSPQQMYTSLAKLGALAGDTQVCCAHEYTLANLRFAREVEPGNAELAEHHSRCERLRAQGLPTLPSTMAVERDINPFLRCTQPEVVAQAVARGASADDAVSVFAALREWKNNFS